MLRSELLGRMKRESREKMLRNQSCGKKRESGWVLKVLISTILKRMRQIVVLERDPRVHQAVHLRGGVTPRKRWIWMNEIFRACNRVEPEG
eukprot:946593-Karenia_brevis.AAC.1